MSEDVVKLKFLVDSESEPSLPTGWANEVFWVQPSTGKIHKWNGSSWVVVSAPLVVVPSEVALGTEVAAVMAAHEALPNVHHAEAHSHATHGDINFTGTVSADGEAGLTGQKTIAGYTFTFKKGLLVGFQAP